MGFKYFKDPHHFSYYIDDLYECNLCKEIQQGYEGIFYGPEKIEFICETCLIQGRLAEIECSTNLGNSKELRKQLRKKYPNILDVDLDEMISQKNFELEQCTPAPVIMYEFDWPCHCADYCCYVKEIGQSDLHDLAEDGDGRKFFFQHLLNPHLVCEEFWDCIRKDSPKDCADSWDKGYYLFQCLSCQHHLIYWNAEF